MKSWVLVLFSDEPYIQRAYKTIYEARTIGHWKDNIVLMVPNRLLINQEAIEFAERFEVELRAIKDINVHSILENWNRFPENPDYSYVMCREFMYHKFQIFDTYFKKWDVVFYLDSGCKIQGDLERMKKSCEPDGCYYAHSDAYPYYEWKLSTQFCFDMISKEDENTMKNLYEFDCDYFQGTMCIYDTKITKEESVNRLYELAIKYPITRRMDQGILNLYFLCEQKLWKQIPVKDEHGFLYDYHEREGYRGRDYLILKNRRFDF